MRFTKAVSTILYSKRPKGRAVCKKRESEVAKLTTRKAFKHFGFYFEGGAKHPAVCKTPELSCRITQCRECDFESCIQKIKL